MLETTLITEVTYLLSVRLASFRWQELYLGLFTELGKLHMNVREMCDRNNLEAEYR